MQPKWAKQQENNPRCQLVPKHPRAQSSFFAGTENPPPPTAAVSNLLLTIKQKSWTRGEEGLLSGDRINSECNLWNCFQTRND
ncbi:hypothetical protein PGT21_008331 [Puccinia graminis f. sp. tritici]|uniref:Uncharacterized protein n=1 Tax=Puccinia graminis f. sp. tritici TaxID=56615 RepID=A0A5B0LNE0_PUCGR|nr:hypothetical protein PGT21_008331 [Puccinia graminis f. sp. tritici]